MRTNRPSSSTEPRHRKPGPARLGGGNGTGRRARDVDPDGPAEDPAAVEDPARDTPA